MLKLLIVDDEKLTRDSLKEYLPYATLGIDQIETAKNGLAALELIEDFMPDIVLCDIRMPKMDGIEFAAKLRVLNPECKIIFISAYADKEYLKSAINLKAVSYIEKPIQIDELTQVLKETATACLIEEQKRIADSIIKNRINLSIPFIREQLLQDILDKKIETTEINSTYGVALMNFPTTGKFTTAHVSLNWKTELTPDEQNNKLHKLLNSFYNNNFIDPDRFLVKIKNNHSFIFIFSGDYTNTDLTSELPQKQLLDFLVNAPVVNFTVSIGIGPVSEDISGIPASYGKACRAANLEFYLGMNNIYYQYDFKSSHIKIDNNYYTEFSKLLRNSAPDKACKIISSITEKFTSALDEDVNYVRNAYFKLLMSVFDVSREQNLISPGEEEESKYIWQEIASFNSLQQISDYLISNVMSIFKRNKGGTALNGKIEKIKKYIASNYKDRNLSLQSISDNVYLSHTYLCSFFKKATGKTLNEYITEVRIENAKILLKSTNVKLYEITLEIGLTDSNYFCNIFKKNTGLTPSEFRERYSYDKEASTSL